MGTMPPPGKSSADVFKCEPKTIDLIWGIILNLMKKHDGGVFRFTEFEIVRKMIRNDNIELWMGVDAGEIELAALTQVCGTKEKYVELFWVGGTNFDKYMDKGLQKIEQWSALIGAKSFVVGGRKGWTRKLKKKGFSFHRIEMIKPVSYVADKDNGTYSWRH